MKKIHEDDMWLHAEWRCPYVSCRHHNIFDGEPAWADELTCYKCKKTVKVSHDYE